MKKDELNAILRKYAQILSPTAAQREQVSRIYKAVCAVLGEANCLQIGSYPRFTAINPPHDLDVLYILERWDGYDYDPTVALANLKVRIESEFANPTDLTVEVRLQTHSISISLSKNGTEFFAVDIVPALIYGKNEFGDDTYVVPEIQKVGHTKRLERYAKATMDADARRIQWIPSDPRGYISVATRLNALNKDFRKSVKFEKHWKSLCKKISEGFKLKSFHVEQIITTYFKNNIAFEIYDALLSFHRDLPKWLERPQIPDRADPNIFIDAYLDEMSMLEKNMILKASDAFLIRLEEFALTGNVEELFSSAEVALKSGLAAAAGSTYTAPAIVSNVRPVRPRPDFGEG